MMDGRRGKQSRSNRSHPLRVPRWRAVLFLAVIASTVPVAAQPVSERPWMTGQQFVELSAWPEGAHSNIDLTPLQAMNQELAKMFLVGVHDATEGKDWCFSVRAKPKPDTLRDQAIRSLRSMNQQQLRRSATELVVEVWRAKYPCARTGSAPCARCRTSRSGIFTRMSRRGSLSSRTGSTPASDVGMGQTSIR